MLVEWASASRLGPFKLIRSSADNDLAVMNVIFQKIVGAARIVRSTDSKPSRAMSAGMRFAFGLALVGWLGFAVGAVWPPLALPPAIAVALAAATMVAAAVALIVVEQGVRRLRSQARTDSLTGLLNHREFQEAVARHIELGSPFAIAMLDLDGFKQLNDQYGHAEGDRLLHAVARALERACRDEDVLGRVGGDEFAIVLPGAGTIEAKAASARLAQAVEAADGRLGASVGVAQWPEDGPEQNALLLRADVSLYSAKQGNDGLFPRPDRPADTSSRGGTGWRSNSVGADAPVYEDRLTGIDRYRGSVVIAASVVFAALVLAARFEAPGSESALMVLLVVPLALTALRFGLIGGALGALTAVLLLELPLLVGATSTSVVGYVTRSISFVVIGLVVGKLSGQTRRAGALLERRVARGIEEVATAKRTVAEERDFLAAALGSLDEGVVACDAHGVLTFFNAATRRLHGLPATEIPASEWAEHYDIYCEDGTTLMPPEEIPLMRAFAGEAIHDVPMVVAPLGKEPRRLIATGRPIIGVDGRQTGAVVAMRDVTEQLRLEHQLEAALAQAMMRLARAVEFRDTDTGAHVERMSHGCRLLAERAGLPPERCTMVEIASRLHDIGKLAVPDAVLLKPGKLDVDEWKLMEAHTLYGHQLLAESGNELLDLAATIALSHHERIDGSGYPHGLRGDTIPIEARIAAIADVFDALTSDRPYRPAFTTGEALAIMTRERGTQFDPHLLDLFIESPPSDPTDSAPTLSPGVAPTAASSGLRDRISAGISADEPGSERRAQQQPEPASSDTRVRECMFDATANLHDSLADARDDELAASELIRLTGTSPASAIERQPSRDRRWIADERARAATRRAKASERTARETDGTTPG